MDTKDENENKYDHLDSPEKQERAEKAVAKLTAIREVKKISGDGKWTIPQQLLQEIIATHTIAKPGKRLPIYEELKKDLIKLIDVRYEDEPDLKDLLLESLPNKASTLGTWVKKEGWDEAVWEKIRGTDLFTKEKRSEMINSLYRRGADKDTQAAKLWLTLSGDYSEKIETSTKDAALDKYREINKVLHKKNGE